MAIFFWLLTAISNHLVIDYLIQKAVEGDGGGIDWIMYGTITMELFMIESNINAITFIKVTFDSA